MLIDIAPDLWIETHPVAAGTEICLQGRSATASRVHYTLELNRQGQQGTARMAQSGQAVLTPGAARTLARVSASLHPEDRCELQVTLSSDGRPRRVRRFACAITPESAFALRELADMEQP